jgi:hypothetical protein
MCLKTNPYIYLHLTKKGLMAEAKLTVHIENKNPIELTDFTESFESLGNEYYKFLSEHSQFKLSSETKLYIKEVKSGSITTILSDLVPMVLPFVEHSNSVIEFTKFLKKGFNYFLGNSTEKPKEFDAKDCSNFNNIIKPIAKDNGSNVTFTGDFNFGDVTINMDFNSIEANAIQNGINRERGLLKEPAKNLHQKVLFYWDSAKYGDKSKAVDRGFIDSINSASLRVTFENQEIKKRMLDIEENPFHFLFIVDVEVMTVQTIPTVYKITELYEVMPK